MTKWRNSFPVRASWRMHEFHGKACPICGQSNPILLTKDGRCANCASGRTEEMHHPVGKGFRKSKEDKRLVIGMSPIAHLIASDWQAAHPAPPNDNPDSDSFWEAWLWEFVAGFAELWLVLTYLNEKTSEEREALLWIAAIGLFVLFLIHLNQVDLSNFVERAKRKLYENKT